MSEEVLIKFDLDYVMKKTKSKREEKKLIMNVDTEIPNIIITVKKEMITDKPKLEPNKIIRSNTVSKENEIYQKGIIEIRIVQANRSNIEKLDQNFFQNIINNRGRTRRKRKKKYSFKIT
jgi:hypothetical protein